MKQPSKPVQVYFPTDLREQLDQRAAADACSVSDLIRQAVVAYLSGEQPATVPAPTPAASIDPAPLLTPIMARLERIASGLADLAEQVASLGTQRAAPEEQSSWSSHQPPRRSGGKKPLPARGEARACLAAAPPACIGQLASKAPPPPIA